MTAGVPIVTVLEYAHLAGLTLFFAGIALGTLLVFTDRHGYDPPVRPILAAAAIAGGILLWLVTWLITWSTTVVGF